MTGPITRPSALFYCDNVACECVEAVLGSDRFVPLCLKAGISLLKDEPSAQIPWAKTMLGLLCLDMVRSFSRDKKRFQRCRPRERLQR
jgi:hypothetical protein